MSYSTEYSCWSCPICSLLHAVHRAHVYVWPPCTSYCHSAWEQSCIQRDLQNHHCTIECNCWSPTEHCPVESSLVRSLSGLVSQFLSQWDGCQTCWKLPQSGKFHHNHIMRLLICRFGRVLDCIYAWLRCCLFQILNTHQQHHLCHYVIICSCKGGVLSATKGGHNDTDPNNDGTLPLTSSTTA